MQLNTNHYFPSHLTSVTNHFDIPEVDLDLLHKQPEHIHHQQLRLKIRFSYTLYRN